MARIGQQTPTASHILPYTESRGREAVDLYNKSPRRQAMEWQASLLDDIMAVDEDGLWVHMVFGFAVPRRNGKNEIIAMRELWGLEHGEIILHTAHKTTTSHEAWERLLGIMDECGYVDAGRKKEGEQLPHNAYRTTKQFGLETITLMSTGGKISFRTRSENNALGLHADCLICDECQELKTTEQSALLYVVSASDNPQTIMIGTPPTLVSAGTVFKDYRDEVLTGTTEDEGWAEWSVDEEPEDISDRDLWYRSNPSLGLKLKERVIRQEMRGDKLDFSIQRLGYWFSYSLKTVINKAEWSALASEEMPELDGKLTVGIKYGLGNDGVSLSVAVRTTDGRIFIEAIDDRPQKYGNAWIVSFLTTLKDQISHIYIDGAKGKDLIEELKDVNIKDASMVSTADFVLANARFLEAVTDAALTHKNQPSLTQAVTNADKRSIGTNGGWGLRATNDAVDISLADSAIIATYYCSKEDGKPKRKQQAYY